MTHRRAPDDSGRPPQKLSRPTLPAPIRMPHWLVLPQGWRAQAVLAHTAERLVCSPAPKVCTRRIVIQKFHADQGSSHPYSAEPLAVDGCVDGAGRDRLNRACDFRLALLRCSGLLGSAWLGSPKLAPLTVQFEQRWLLLQGLEGAGTARQFLRCPHSPIAQRKTMQEPHGFQS